MSGETESGRENYWVFQSALILVFILLNYSFRLISAHFSVVSRLESQYEMFKGQEQQKGEKKMRDLGNLEVKYTKLFNEAHKENVLTNFAAELEKDENKEKISKRL